MTERCRWPHPQISGVVCDLHSDHDGGHRGHTGSGTYLWDTPLAPDAVSAVAALADEWEAEADAIEQDGTPVAEVERFTLRACAGQLRNLSEQTS